MNILKIKKQQQISAYQIMEVVSESTKVGIRDMQTNMQHREIVEARYIGIALTVEKLPWLSYKEISQLYHRSAPLLSYAIRQAKNLYEVDFVFAEKYKQAEEAINQFIINKQQ